LSVVIIKWQRLPKPVGKTIGFTAVSWFGLIVDAFAVSEGPRGLSVLDAKTAFVAATMAEALGPGEQVLLDRPLPPETSRS
jgi:hypothetical protein